MASFQAKIVWKRPRKRENKNNSLVLFLPDALQKIQKKQQNNSKNKKKYNYGFISSVERGRERKKITIFVLFRSYPTRNRKFQKKRKKIQKNLKNTIMAPFQATIG